MSQLNVYEILFMLAKLFCRKGFYVSVNGLTAFENSAKTLRPAIEEQGGFSICSYSAPYGLVWAWPPFKRFSQLTVIAHAAIKNGRVVIYAYTQNGYDDLRSLKIEGAEIELALDRERVLVFEFNTKTRKWERFF